MSWLFRSAALFLVFSTAAVLVSTDQASAAEPQPTPFCFGPSNSLGVPTSQFPRTGQSKISSLACANTPASTGYDWRTGDTNGAHIILSAYYSIGIGNPMARYDSNGDGSITFKDSGYNGEPGSTLHTPNASVRIFTNNPNAVNRVTVNVWYCTGGASSAGNVFSGLVGSANGPIQYGTTTFSLSGIGTGLAQFTQITAGSTGAYVSSSRLKTSIPETSGRLCKISYSSDTPGTTISYHNNDNNPGDGTRGPKGDKYNQNGWWNDRATIGPSSGDGAFALRTDYDDSTLEYALTFAPDCIVTSARQIYLKVYDSDAPSGGNPVGTTQNPPSIDDFPRMLVYEYDQNGGYITTHYPAGDSLNRVFISNDSYSSYPMTIQPTHKYAWVWWNVAAKNGLQLWAPYSDGLSVVGAGNCGPPGTCQITVPIAFIYGTSRRVDVKITNTSSAPMTFGVPGDTGGKASLGIIDPTNPFDNGGQWDGTNTPDRTRRWRAVGTAADSTVSLSSFYDNTDGVWKERISSASEVTLVNGGSYTFRFYLTPQTSPGAWMAAGSSQRLAFRILNRALPSNVWMAVLPGCDVSVPIGQPPPPGVVTCTLQAPPVIEPGGSYRFRVNVTYTGAAATVSATASVTAIGVTRVSDPFGGYTYGLSPITVPFQTAPIDFLAAGNFPIAASVSGSIDGTAYVPTTCDGATSITVASKPYFKVFGGGATVGAGFNNGTATCTPPNATQAGRVSGFATIYNDPVSRVSSLIGASTQFELRALGLVADAFYSFGGPPFSPASQEYKARTFANTPASGSFGGGFGGSACITDYFTTTRNAGVLPASADAARSIGQLDAVAGSGNQVEWSAGSLELTGGNLPLGGKLVIYVPGDVYISGDITLNLADAGYSTVADIPFFALVVKGNIKIGPSVTRLDGLYTAQPNTATGTGGTIYTCINFDNTIPDLYSSPCRTNKLTFNGSVVAKSIKLLRTVGTLRLGTSSETSGSANIAEVFNGMPELFIANPAFKVDETATKLYDSVTTLPPLL